MIKTSKDDKTMIVTSEDSPYKLKIDLSYHETSKRTTHNESLNTNMMLKLCLEITHSHVLK